MGVQRCPDCGELVYGGMLQHWGECGKHKEKVKGERTVPPVSPNESRPLTASPNSPQAAPNKTYSETPQGRWKARNPDKVRAAQRELMRKRRVK